MKKFLSAVFIAIAFLGCGGGSSSSNPVLAEATIANAFKAYDAASVSTYLPSFLAKIYNDISNSGNSGKLECADGGTVDVEYYQFDADVPASELFPVKHVFSSCKMHIGSYNITLNGTTRMARTASKEQIVGFAKEGFSFKIGNSPDITYKNFPLKSDDAFTIAVAQGLAQGDKGSFFGVAYIQNSEQVEIHSALHEKTLGDVLFMGSFLNAVSLQIDDSSIINGVFLLPDDEYGKLQININSKEYFELDDASDIATSHKTPLLGKDGKIVYVWQDSSGTVHAEADGNEVINNTAYTPSFSH